MKKQTINFSWPATLSDFKQDETQGNFSRGKLSVFYKGETADHRYFSDEFAEEVIKTLPYSPVVSQYDEDSEDFIGHASEQQIYGIVDPCTEIEFKELEDGKTWCVCDVVLYTERPDKTGEIAKKIIGQPHSLELDPKTVKYKVNYDEKKHFKNIEFTAGSFVGVSVLGKNQKPAFTGSGFFSCDEFESKMQILKNYCASQADEKQSGGESMNLQEFMTLSWGEISTKVNDAICEEYHKDAYTYVVDMYADYAIARFYYYMESGSRLMKINYTCDEQGNVTLGDIIEVHVAYEPVAQEAEVEVEKNMEQIDETSIDAVNSLSNEEPEDNKDEEENVEDKKEDEEVTEAKAKEDDEVEKCVEDVKEDDKEEEKEDDKEEEVKDEINCASEVQPIEPSNDNFEEEIVEENSLADETPAQVSNVEITPTQMEASVENEQDNIQETNSGTTSLTESERQEFEALKREKKVNIVNSYKDSLTEEEYENFVSNIDNFSEQGLELELLKIYKRQQQESNNSAKQVRAFAFAPINNATSDSPLDAFVRKNTR